jgi:hypothetical protein
MREEINEGEGQRVEANGSGDMRRTGSDKQWRDKEEVK